MISRIKDQVVNHPLFRASIVYTLTDAINKGIPFLLLPVLTFYLSPADFGITANYNIYVNVLAVFVSLSISGSFSVNFYKISKPEASRYLSSMLMVIFVSFIGFATLAFIFSDKLSNLLPVGTVYIVAGAVISLGQSVTAINLDLFRLRDQALRSGLYEISQGLFAIIIPLILLIPYHLRWESRVIASVLTASSFGMLSLFFIWKQGYLTTKISWRMAKEGLAYGIPLLPYSLSVWLRFGIDRIFITKFCGQAETGVYATALQFGILISFLTLALNNAFTPYLYKILSNPDEQWLHEQKLKLVRLTYTYFAGLLAVGVFLSILSKFLIKSLLSPSFIKAVDFIPVIIASQVIQGMCLMLSLYILFVKKTGTLTLITAICGIAQLVISYFAVRNLGSIGGAYASLITNVLNLAAVWYFSARVYHMPWNFLRNYKPEQIR